MIFFFNVVDVIVFSTLIQSDNDCKLLLFSPIKDFERLNVIESLFFHDEEDDWKLSSR